MPEKDAEMNQKKKHLKKNIGPQSSIQVLKNKVQMSNYEMLQLTHRHNKGKFLDKIYQLNDQGVVFIQKQDYESALILLTQVQKLLQYAACCGQSLNRSIIIRVLHNEAVLFQRMGNVDRSIGYVEAIIFNLKGFLSNSDNMNLQKKLNQLAQDGLFCSRQLRKQVETNKQQLEIILHQKYKLFEYYIRFSVQQNDNKNLYSALCFLNEAIDGLHTILKNILLIYWSGNSQQKQDGMQEINKIKTFIFQCKFTQGYMKKQQLDQEAAQLYAQFKRKSNLTNSYSAILKKYSTLDKFPPNCLSNKIKNTSIDSVTTLNSQSFQLQILDNSVPKVEQTHDFRNKLVVIDIILKLAIAYNLSSRFNDQLNSSDLTEQQKIKIKNQKQVSKQTIHSLLSAKISVTLVEEMCPLANQCFMNFKKQYNFKQTENQIIEEIVKKKEQVIEEKQNEIAIKQIKQQVEIREVFQNKRPQVKQQVKHQVNKSAKQQQNQQNKKQSKQQNKTQLTHQIKMQIEDQTKMQIKKQIMEIKDQVNIQPINQPKIQSKSKLESKYLHKIQTKMQIKPQTKFECNNQEKNKNKHEEKHQDKHQNKYKITHQENSQQNSNQETFQNHRQAQQMQIHSLKQKYKSYIPQSVQYFQPTSISNIKAETTATKLQSDSYNYSSRCFQDYSLDFKPMNMSSKQTNSKLQTLLKQHKQKNKKDNGGTNGPPKLNIDLSEIDSVEYGNGSTTFNKNYDQGNTIQMQNCHEENNDNNFDGKQTKKFNNLKLRKIKTMPNLSDISLKQELQDEFPQHPAVNNPMLKDKKSKLQKKSDIQVQKKQSKKQKSKSLQCKNLKGLTFLKNTTQNQKNKPQIVQLNSKTSHNITKRNPTEVSPRKRSPIKSQRESKFLVTKPKNRSIRKTNKIKTNQQIKLISKKQSQKSEELITEMINNQKTEDEKIKKVVNVSKKSKKSQMQKKFGESQHSQYSQFSQYKPQGNGNIRGFNQTKNTSLLSSMGVKSMGSLSFTVKNNIKREKGVKVNIKHQANFISSLALNEQKIKIECAQNNEPNVSNAQNSQIKNKRGSALAFDISNTQRLSKIKSVDKKKMLNRCKSSKSFKQINIQSQKSVKGIKKVSCLGQFVSSQHRRVKKTQKVKK